MPLASMSASRCWPRSRNWSSTRWPHMASGPVPGGAASSGVQKCSSSAIVLTRAIVPAGLLHSDPNRDPLDTAGMLRRAADHGLAPPRAPERFGDLIEQCLGLRVVRLHDQLAEPGRVAEALAAAQYPGGIQDHRELVDRLNRRTVAAPSLVRHGPPGQVEGDHALVRAVELLVHVFGQERRERREQ